MKQLKSRSKTSLRFEIRTGDLGDRFYVLQRPDGTYVMAGPDEGDKDDQLVLFLSPIEAQRDGAVDAWFEKHPKDKRKFQIRKCIVATPQG